MEPGGTDSAGIQENESFSSNPSALGDLLTTPEHGKATLKLVNKSRKSKTKTRARDRPKVKQRSKSDDVEEKETSRRNKHYSLGNASDSNGLSTDKF